MRVSEAVKVDKAYRERRKVETITQTIESRYKWYLKYRPDDIRPIHTIRKQQVVEKLRHCWTEAAVNGKVLVKMPVAEILDYVFEYARKPKAAQLSEAENAMVQLMNMRGRELAKQMQQFQLACEIAYRAYQGWYMVFQTLTVAPEHYYDVFNKGSTAFTDYIRRIDRMVAASAYGTVRAAKGQDYHTHFACVEEGGKHGRLHIHCLHFFKELPAGAADPNAGRLRPTERHLLCMKSIWPYGRDDPVMVRYSPQDAYGKKGYRWPIDPKTQTAMLVRSPLALSSYMSKYLKKAHLSCQRKKLLWRVRKSHRLGQPVLDELVGRLSISTRVILTVGDTLKSRLNNQLIPQSLVRLAAMRSLQTVDQCLTSPSGYLIWLSELAKLASPRLSPLHSLRASTQMIQENSQRNMQFLSTLGYSSEDISKAWRDLWYHVREVNRKYFPEPRAAYGTTSTRDHLYGT